VKIFLTGATGYIGGSIARRLVSEGHTVQGLLRSEARKGELAAMGIDPLVGGLDDIALVGEAAQAADATINAASADHRGAVEAICDALSGSGKLFLHTSGSSIVGTRAGGLATDDIYDEDTPLEPSPARAARVALNRDILGYAEKGVRAVILCPSLIYGLGHGIEPHSMQAPWLIALAERDGVAKHVGPGENIWSNVHIDDLVDLYMLALAEAPAGGFYFAENGENAMKEVCQAISRMLGYDGRTLAMSAEEAAAVWGDGPANATMGSNSRVRARRARQELGWTPKGASLLQEIATGCYTK